MELEVPDNFDKYPWEFETICDVCGCKFITTKQRFKKNKHSCCSRKCASILLNGEYNCECVVCHKQLHRKPSYIKRTKDITCSYECCYKLKKITMSGENNHQYGLTGERNSSFKTGEFINYWGYKKIYSPGHPETRDNYTLMHRIVAEMYLLDDINSYEYEHGRFLSKDYIVHHLDFDRLNNDPNNLVVMRKDDHSKFHNSLRNIIRDKDGRITAVQDNSEQLSGQQLRNEFYKYVEKNNIYYNALPTSRIDKKIMELALVPYVDYIIEETDTLSETKRGEGGIGSTGK